MADYRSWCATCNAEINFGGHQPGCPVPAQQRDFESKRQAEKDAKDRELVAAWKDLLDDKEALFSTMFELETHADKISLEYSELEEERNAGLRLIMMNGIYYEYSEWRREQRRAAKARG